MPVLLTHGYFLAEDVKEQKIMKPYPPLGILYLSAWLEKHNENHEVFDSTFHHFNDFISLAENLKPTLIGIYVNLMTRLNVIRMIGWLRKNLPSATIVLGGPEARHHAHKFCEAGGGVVVNGEGEITFLELVQLHRSGNWSDETLSMIPGISFLKNGKLVTNVERDKIKWLNDLPEPNRKKIDMQKYFSAWKNIHGSSSLSISTMRGCPYTCKWCSRAVYGNSYRRIPAKHTADEIEKLIHTYQPDAFWFVDDVFTISPNWMKQFSAEVEQRKLTFQYECISRADRLNEEIMHLLKKTGCFRLWIGAESGSQHVLDAMDRRVQASQVREMIQLAKKYGIEAGTFLMVGYPGETDKDVQLTLEHLKKSRPDHFTITISYPIKGTPLYDEMESSFTQRPAWEKSTDRDIDFKRTYGKRYYHYAVRWIMQEMKAATTPSWMERAKAKGKAILLRLAMKYWVTVQS